MRIKTKITFGVGLLFLMILALATISSWYVNRLKKDTNNILAANYNTLLYGRNMLLALEDLEKDSAAWANFQDNLDKQKQNVTEVGEKEATDFIVRHWGKLRLNPSDGSILSALRRDITEVMRLNMGAIELKSDVADRTAKHAIIVISVAGGLCFLIAFVLLINLPSNIANPIQELTESIKAIAAQNYRKRVHFEGHSEFGDLARSFNTMAEKLEEYSESRLEKILQGKKRIETLIDNMHDPVIGIDQDKKVLFVNNEALKISGLKEEDFVGLPIQDVAVRNDLIRDIIKDLFLPETVEKSMETLKIYADGKESYFEKEIIAINIFPTGESESQFIGQVILLRNITPFKELDLAKTNFIGAVSHEFKTPIASIRMGVQLLENEQVGVLNEEQRDLIKGIHDDTERLLKITAELLNVTQIESGSIQINVSAVEIEPMITYAIHANRAAADQKQVKLNVHLAEDVTSVMADSEKTAWVLTNLLSNAIRYSHENAAVEVAVQRVEDMVLFTVSDTGQGIQAEYLEKIFERYFRIPGTKKDGTGLGLSISKEFIEAQGGHIVVKSEYGAGSTFSFTLKAS